MDGIHPTLAFAALFLGLSGNAHHATNTPPSQVELRGAIECPALTLSGNLTKPSNQSTWTEAFENSLVGPDDLEPKSADAAAAGPERSSHDPIMRHLVPVASSDFREDPETDPCTPDR
ncbi:MAG: hypothetical protein R3D05_02170 [Dongiaceae bacterium]